MSNFWDDQNDSESFRDVPDEVQGIPAQGAPPIHEPVAKPAPVSTPISEGAIVNVDLVEQIEMSEEDEEIDNQSVLSNARLRLEQGRLYEMVMTSNLFENLDADQQAIKNVQRELKKFAKERMEVMLGMRAEKTPESTIVSSPFNDLEVTVLKKLASAATKGLSESPEANKIATTTAPAAPKKQALTPIGAHAKKPEPKPLASTPAKPISRRELAKKTIPQPDFKPLEKDPAEMTPEELAEHNKAVAARQAGKKAMRPANAAPMPSPGQEEVLYAQMASENAANSLAKNPAVSAIAAAIIAKSQQKS